MNNFQYVLCELAMAGKTVKSIRAGAGDSDNRDPYISVTTEEPGEGDVGPEEDESVNGKDRELKPAIDAAKKTLARAK